MLMSPYFPLDLLFANCQTANSIHQSMDAKRNEQWSQVMPPKLAPASTTAWTPHEDFVLRRAVECFTGMQIQVIIIVFVLHAPTKHNSVTIRRIAH